MQGRRQFVDKVVLRFRLSERVPQQNLYRRLSELLDWDFLYGQTQALYSHMGLPSLDRWCSLSSCSSADWKTWSATAVSSSTAACGSISSIFWATR